MHVCRNLKTLIDGDVKVLFDLLNKTDELMLVGGCIRNFILDKEVNDFDFATRLKPTEIIDILRKNNIKYLTIGIKFGTVTAVINDNKYEITTLRNDFNTDGRHTDVVYTNSYFEDAKRRDFSFNALYLDYNGNVYDYFNGLDDLKTGIIKFIGEPERRIQEDYLRILRFFRFYSEYCFTFDYKGFLACVKYKNKIKTLSKERIKYEILKIINGAYPIKVLKIMEYYGFICEILGIEHLDLYNLEIFCSVKNFINYTPNNVFNLSLILLRNNIEDIKKNLVLTNNEYNFIEKILLYKDESINKNNLKKLFFILKDKEIIKGIIVANITNSNCKNYVEEINTYLHFLDTLETIKLPITTNDLENIGIKQKDYGYYMNLAKNYFIESNFECKHNEILEMLLARY